MPESFPADGSGGMPPMDQPHIVGSDDQIYPIPPGQNPNWMGVPGHSPHPESLSPSASSQGANPIAHSSADPLRRAMGLRPRGEMEALRDMGYQGSWNRGQYGGHGYGISQGGMPPVRRSGWPSP